MATVQLWSALRPAVGGAHSIDIDAQSIRELFNKLEARYPDTRPFIERGIAVSVNGDIYRDSWDKTLDQDAEIYLLPRIEGG